uniref:Uncharacterized protein n=1 Tax=Ditylenchus dipsaci TaxID=166011 RepID=A0A915DP56_9BILA
MLVKLAFPTYSKAPLFIAFGHKGYEVHMPYFLGDLYRVSEYAQLLNADGSVQPHQSVNMKWADCLESTGNYVVPTAAATKFECQAPMKAHSVRNQIGIVTSSTINKINSLVTDVAHRERLKNIIVGADLQLWHNDGSDVNIHIADVRITNVAIHNQRLHDVVDDSDEIMPHIDEVEQPSPTNDSDEHLFTSKGWVTGKLWLMPDAARSGLEKRFNALAHTWTVKATFSTTVMVLHQCHTTWFCGPRSMELGHPQGPALD